MHSTGSRRRPCCIALFLCIFAASGVRHCRAANVLMFPGNHNAEVLLMSRSAHEIVKLGHQVTIIVTKTKSHLTEIPSIVLDIPPEAELEKCMEKLVVGSFADGRSFGPMAMFQHSFDMKTVLHKFCEYFMQNETLWRQLEADKYDLVMLSNIPFYRCSYLLPYKLGIPHVSYSSFSDPWNSDVAALPSTDPNFLLPFAAPLSFPKRIINLLATFASSFWFAKFICGDGYIGKYAPERPRTTFSEIFYNTSLFLVAQDGHCFDYPSRPRAGNMKYVGGGTARAAQPLPENLRRVADSGPFILMSFGSIAVMSNLPNVLMDKFVKAFARLKVNVIIRRTGPPLENQPRNVYAHSWLPQNDLLGHPNAKLFVTHGGSNGAQEALFHVVPMLAFPIAGDQAHNAARAVARGFARSAELFDSSSDEIYEAINEMLGNPSYRNSLFKCASLLRKLPTAHAQVAMWVDHVAVHGSEHLKGSRLPLYQLLMLDVLLALVVALSLALSLALGCLAFCCRKCCCRRAITQNSKQQAEYSKLKRS